MSRGGVKELKVIVESERTNVNDENSNITNNHVEKIISSPSTTTLPLQQEEVMTPTLPSSSSISMAKYRQIESDLFKHIKEFKNSYINDKDVLNSLEEKLKVQKEALETQQNLLKQQDILKQELITNLNKANRKINELETSSNNVDEAVLKLRKELSGANDRYGRKDVLYKELNEKYKMLEQKLTEKQNTVVHLTNKSYKDEEKIKMLNAKLDISTESTKEIVSNTANIEHELEKYKRLHEEMKEKFLKKDEECGMYEAKSQTLQKEMDGMTKAFQLKENEIISGFNMKLNTKKSEVQSLQTRIGKVMANHEKEMRELNAKLKEFIKQKKENKTSSEKIKNLTTELHDKKLEIDSLKQYLDQATNELKNHETISAIDREKSLKNANEKLEVEMELRKEISDLESKLKLENTKNNLLIENINNELGKKDLENNKLLKEIEEIKNDRDKSIEDAKRLTNMRGLIESRFSELAEQCQRVMGERDALKSENGKLLEKNAQDNIDLEKREKELNTALSKLSAAEEAVEGEMTCMECLQIFDNPCILQTGETYCAKCVETIKNEKKVEYTIPNKQIATLAGKFVFMKQSIAAIKAMQQEAK